MGLEIKYLHNGLFLSQHKYATDLVHKARLDACNTYLTLCQSGLKLYADSGTPLSSSDITLFRSLVGCLQHPTFTRLDITYSVNVVCQFLHNPTDIHLHAVKPRYVKGTLDFGSVFRKGTSSLSKRSPLTAHVQSFCDTDWAGDPND